MLSPDHDIGEESYAKGNEELSRCLLLNAGVVEAAVDFTDHVAMPAKLSSGSDEPSCCIAGMLVLFCLIQRVASLAISR